MLMMPLLRLHVINCGVKAFERVELKDPVVIAPYRVCQEMTKTLLPHMKKRKALLPHPHLQATSS